MIAASGPTRPLLRMLVPALLALLALLLGVAGCQTESVVTNDGRPLPPDPRPAPPVPRGAQPNRMILLVGRKPDDSDGNGYPDLIRVETALFAQPHPTSMSYDGAFVFTLYRLGETRQPGAVPLAEWRIAGDEQRDALARAPYGACYRFRLSLLDAGVDERPVEQADLRGRFEPAGGGPAISASDEVRPVVIGRR